MARIDAVAKLAPLSVLSSATTAVVITATFWAQGPKPYLGFLLVLIELVAAVMLVACRQWLVSSGRVAAAIRARGVVTALAGLLGIVWASLPAMVFVASSANQRMLLAGAMIGLVATGIVLAPVMEAALAFMLPILAGCFLALSVRPEPFFTLIYLLLLAYGAFVSVSAIYLSRMFVGRLSDQMMVEEQSDTIRLLLWDFEHSISNSLWTLGADEAVQAMLQRLGRVLGRRREPSDEIGAVELSGGALGVPAPVALARLTARIAAREPFRDEVVRVRVEGQTLWWSLTGLPFSDSEGRFKGFRGVGSDVTVAKENEARIAHLARHDGLTDLLNGPTFLDVLASEVERCRTGADGCSLLYLDLDGFKQVNDTHGHPVGDAVLKIVAMRLKGCLRDADVVARVGGDEFAVLQYGGDAITAGALAGRIIEHVGAACRIGRMETRIGISIGIALGPADGETAEALVKNADLALYRAKAAGRNTHCFFDRCPDPSGDAAIAMPSLPDAPAPTGPGGQYERASGYAAAAAASEAR